jgi:DNA-binding NarL/FixJ family response regulator
MNKKSILVIEDEEIIRHTLSEDLSHEGYLVNVASNGDEGVKKFSKNSHDLVIVDLIMEGMGGIQAIREIKKIRSDTPVIILTGYGGKDSAIDALRLGVLDYFPKPYPRKEFLRKVAQCLAYTKSSGEKRTGALDIYRKMDGSGLTKREIEVCIHMREGLTYEKLAESMCISKHTVKNHLKSIFKKLEVNSGTELVALLNR